eukprot:1643959-Pyramimonas_sp.AAC.1
MDLSKSYDSIDHGVAVAALERECAPDAVVYCCLAAWGGPRVCCVYDEPAEPLRGSRGLPQGDSCAPGATVAALVPWDCTPAHGRAYMDDRSLASTGPRAPE